LSAYRVRSALALYTKVLTELSPGHPCAFLNRSLCYLTLDYPNLAAIDAYRAILGATWAKSKTKTPQTKQILTFGRFTQNTKSGQEYDWAVKPGWHVGLGVFEWLRNDLSKLAIDPKERLKRVPSRGPDKAVNIIGLSLVDSANDIILKGYYRLAFALWKCGGGALRSALDVLGDAQALPCCTYLDLKQFRELENAILLEIEELLKEEEGVKLLQMQNNALTLDAKTLELYEQLGFLGLAKTRFTKIKREMYPWDFHSLTDGNEEAFKAIEDMVKEKFGEICRAGMVHDKGKVPKTVLYAQQDIPGSTLLFGELSSFHATSHHPSRHGIPCDLCASHLKASGELFLRANKIARGLQEAQPGRSKSRSDRSPAPSEDSQRTRSFDITTLRSEPASSSSVDPALAEPTASSSATQEGDTDIAMASPLNYEDAAESPSDGSPKRPSGFQLCPECRQIALCSEDCCDLALSLYHANCCQMGLPEYLRSRVLDVTWPDVPEPHLQVLLNLLFLRIAAHTMPSTEHPLAEPWMRSLDGGLDAPRDIGRDWNDDDPDIKPAWKEHNTVDLDDIFPERMSWDKLTHKASEKPEARNLIPWSFDNNVRLPLHCLFTLGGTELALDAARYDGWVLETIRAKIASAMRVTRYPRSEKTFNNDGDMIDECIIKQQPLTHEYDGGHSDHFVRKIYDDEEINWVASLHPVASLIRVAADGETPNVQLFERHGKITCKTLNDPKAVKVEHGKEKRRSDVSDSQLLSNGLMDLDMESDSTTCIKPGEPLLRAAELEPLGPGADVETVEWRPYLKKDMEESTASSSVATQTESSLLYDGDTMLDANETEWGEDFEMEDEDEVMEDEEGEQGGMKEDEVEYVQVDAAMIVEEDDDGL
jgi:hypothetical protein